MNIGISRISLLVFALCAFCALANSACTPEQLQGVYSPCSGGQRTVTYRTLAQCNPPPPAVVNCECTPYDYVAQYGECRADHLRVKSYKKATDCTDGTAQPESSLVSCLCTPEQLQFTFGICDAHTKTRQVVFFYPEDCTGTPPKPRAVPCDFKCAPGQRLDPNTVTCLPCTAGSHSLGGGIAMNTWAVMPEALKTACTGRNCSAWKAHGEYISSGENTGKDGIRSWVSTSVEIVGEGGYVRFAYRVDAEPEFDGLEFFVDGRTVMPLKSTAPRFLEVQFPLSIGHHDLRWLFRKDDTKSEGLDVAMLRFIRVSGTNFADLRCTPCPAGHMSGEGAATCTPCPPNTAAETPGSSSCAACTDLQYSYTGSPRCTDRAPCTANDYEEVWGPCTGGQRTKFYAWAQPMICNNLTGIRLPPPVPNQPCAPCNPGHHRVGDACEPCPNGHFRSEHDAACLPCPSGHSAPKSVFYQHFDQWPAALHSGCDGEMCGTSWRLRQSHLDSGKGHHGAVESWLELRVYMVSEGRAQFTVEMDCYGDSFLRFFVDGEPDAWPFTRYWHEPFTYWVNLPSGFHTLRWVFTKGQFHEGEPNDFAMIHEIKVTGTNVGGALNCTGCAAGTFASEGSLYCHECDHGSYSGPTAGNCTACPEGTFMEGYGAAQCERCGNGTTSGPGATECDYGCTFQVSDGVSYDLTALSRHDEMYGPIFGSAGHKYYLNICSKDHRNHTCFDYYGRPIPTFACQVTGHGYSVDAGHALAYNPLPDPRGGLAITYDHGDKCGDGTPRKTYLTMRCDLDAGVGYPEPMARTEDPACNYHFQWFSQHACPLCLESDVVTVKTKCSGGKRTVIEEYKSGVVCHGGRVLAPSRSEQCPNDIGAPIGAIIGVAAAFAIIAIIAIVLWRYNRRLKYRYNLLRDQNEDARLSDLTRTAMQDDEDEGPAPDTQSAVPPPPSAPEPE